MKKLLVLLLVLITLCSLSYADQTCYTNEECIFETVVIDGSSYYDGSVNNSLFKGNITYYLDQPMVQVVRNTTRLSYTYNYTFNESGEYSRVSIANNKIVPEKITVSNYSIEEPLATSMFNTILLFLLLIILIGGGIYLLFKNK